MFGQKCVTALSRQTGVVVSSLGRVVFTAYGFPAIRNIVRIGSREGVDTAGHGSCQREMAKGNSRLGDQGGDLGSNTFRDFAMHSLPHSAPLYGYVFLIHVYHYSYIVPDLGPNNPLVDSALF